MFDITLITMGKLKEKFYISAAEEYKKRLGGYCKFTLLELPEVKGGGLVIKKYPARLHTVTVRDMYELKDVDSPEDLEELLER